MLRAARNRNLLKHCVYFDKLFKISYWANHFSEAKNIIVWGDQKIKVLGLSTSPWNIKYHSLNVKYWPALSWAGKHSCSSCTHTQNKVPVVWGREGGVQKNFYMGRLHPKVTPLSLLYTIVDREGTPFRCLLY